MRKRGPSAAEIETIGRELVKYWAASRKPLKPYVDGRLPWSGALRTVRGSLREALKSQSRGVHIPISVRQRWLDFSGDYGTDIRETGAEPLTVRPGIRWAASEWLEIQAAADATGVTAAEFVRGAALLAAQETRESK